MSDVGDDDVGEDAGASGGRRRRLDDGDGDGDDDDGGGASSSTSSDSGSGGAGDERNREEAELLPDFAYTNLTELAMANMSLASGGGGVGGVGVRHARDRDVPADEIEREESNLITSEGRAALASS